MKIGVLADIHGNLHALAAVLADMRGQQVDQVIFLGDAYGEFPYAREVVDALQALPDCLSVRGNRERYLTQRDWQSPRWLKAEQYAAIAWSYRALSPAQRDWLVGLPDMESFQYNELLPVFMAHESDKHFGQTMIDGVDAALWLNGGREGCETYLDAARRDEATRQAIDAQPDGVYLFGHRHAQWNRWMAGKLLLNPGACGLPLDGSTDAPYSILEEREGRWRAQERRVAYDVDGAIAALQASELFRVAEVFSTFNCLQLRDARPYFFFFMREMNEKARREGIHSDPFDNVVWRQSAAQWLARQGLAL